MVGIGWMMTALALVSLGGHAQEMKPVVKPLTYDVVSVKASSPDAKVSKIGPKPDGVVMANIDLTTILEWAYGLRNANDDQIFGLPGWAKAGHFDVEAKVSPDDAAAYKALSQDEKDAMLRAILEDRFKLKAHTEIRQLPVYNLVVAKGGPKLKLADPANDYAKGLTMNDKAMGAGAFFIRRDGTASHAEFQACGIERLVPILTQQAEKTVIDKTGLTGKYDITLEWTPYWVKDDTAITVPRLLTALPEQLGLKLEPAKGPVSVLIVEHVELPTAN